MQPNSQHNCGHTFSWRGVRGNVGGPTGKFLAATALSSRGLQRLVYEHLISMPQALRTCCLRSERGTLYPVLKCPAR